MAWPAGAAYVGLPLNRWDPQLASLPGLSPAGCPMTTAAPSTALATIQPAFTDGLGTQLARAA